MGHHPPVGQVAPTAASTGGGLSPATWFFIVIGIGIGIYIIYWLLTKKKK